MKVTKLRFIHRFKKWVPYHQRRMQDVLDGSGDPVRGLIKLYAHQRGAIKDLQECRINPDFNTGIRNDLEFYIPQLCCIYLYGEVDEPHELVSLLQISSKSSIFFSHRVWFFFQSLLYTPDDNGKRHKKLAELMLSNLKRICIDSQELMCLMGSMEIIKHIVKFGMVQQYPHLLRHLDGLMKIDDQ